MGPFTWILHVKHTLKNFGKFEFFPKFIHNSPKMVGGTLYTYPDNFRAQKVLIAAEYSGAKVKLASNFVFGETNTTKEFLAKFPSGKVRFQYIHFAMVDRAKKAIKLFSYINRYS